MLDERWSEDVEEIGLTLRRLLTAESTPSRVRAAEEARDGVDPALMTDLEAFGLADLTGEPDLFARIALELGRALASTHLVETLPVLALTGRPGVALGIGRPAPSSLSHVAVAGTDGVRLQLLTGPANLTTAGDRLIEPRHGGDGERLGGPDLADRLARFAALTEAARLVGAAQGLLAYGAAYAREREQFGKPIGGYQGIAHKLADVAIAIDGADLLVRKAAFTALDRAGGDGAPSAVFAALVWAKAVDAARLTATHMHQVMGGAGFAMEYDVQLFSRRIRSWSARGPRPGPALADVARAALDPARRDAIRLLWQYDAGMPLPRWAREADAAEPRL